MATVRVSTKVALPVVNNKVSNRTNNSRVGNMVLLKGPTQPNRNQAVNMVPAPIRTSLLRREHQVRIPINSMFLQKLKFLWHRL